jgi:N-acetylmuramoyl-L-alanine amidase
MGNATYGVSRVDVCTAYPGRAGCPYVGYSYALDTTKLTGGPHTLAVVATATDSSADTGSSSVPIQVSPPPSVFIDSLAPGATISGTVSVAGWAIDNTTTIGTAISSVQVKVDGTPMGTAVYGTPRPDVCVVYPGRPGCPNVGFTYSLNTASLSAGTHTITVLATDSDANPDTGSYSITVTK